MSPSPLPSVLTRVLSALDEKKALSPLVLDVRELVGYTDYLVLCAGTSGTHVRALVSAVEGAAGRGGLRVNSSSDDSWWVLDQVDWVVHVFREDARRFYDLEGLWADAAVVKMESQQNSL